MTTEDKIKEAFEAYSFHSAEELEVPYSDFKAGYMACLNSLEQCGTINSSGHPKHISRIYGAYECQLYGKALPVYRLPEGVTKP